MEGKTVSKDDLLVVVVVLVVLVVCDVVVDVEPKNK
jgi:hypothetical protein